MYLIRLQFLINYYLLYKLCVLPIGNLENSKSELDLNLPKAFHYLPLCSPGEEKSRCRGERRLWIELLEVIGISDSPIRQHTKTFLISWNSRISRSCWRRRRRRIWRFEVCWGISLKGEKWRKEFPDKWLDFWMIRLIFYCPLRDYWITPVVSSYI